MNAAVNEQADAAQRLLQELRWEWRDNPEFDGCIDLFDANGRVLAWIRRRPGYCDRGHWAAGVECVPSLDEQDEFARYFMRKATAQAELVEFLAWRLHKRRAE